MYQQNWMLVFRLQSKVRGRFLKILWNFKFDGNLASWLKSKSKYHFVSSNKTEVNKRRTKKIDIKKNQLRKAVFSVHFWACKIKPFERVSKKKANQK